MSLCINPGCRQPNHPDNGSRTACAACGSALVLQGRYRVMRLISSDSGFGRVYEAYERNVPKVLKVLKESHNANGKVVELFRREAQVLSQLNHPGVPRVEPEGYFLYSPVGRAEPLHCLIMEKIEGPNLKQWMVQQGNHPISEKQAMLWLTQIADVLDLVHQHHYFHRDIKPENIMLRPSGQLVLVDFGAAREMTQTYMANLGDSGITTVSSAGYTPPEQEHGQAVPQSDFYALGRTLIYLMTARLPNDPSIYNSRTNAFAWRPLAPHISAPLADLVNDLIAPAAANRPQNTAVILERLAQVRSRQASGLPRLTAHAPIPWPKTTLNPGQAETVADPASSFLPPWLDQRPWLLAGLTGLALAVPLGWYALSRGLPPFGAEAPRVEAPVLQELTVSAVDELTGHTADIYDLLLLRDGNTLISASADDTVRIWDVETGTLRHTLEHPNVVNAIATTTDQTTLISAGDDRTIRFWSLPDGRPLGQIDNAHGTTVRALEVDRSGRILVSADSAGTIQFWPLTDSTGVPNLAALTPDNALRTLRADGTVNDLLFTRDNSRLISGGNSLQIWNLDDLGGSEDGGESVTLTGHTSFVNRIDITGDDNTLISASADQNVLLWDMATYDQIAALKGHRSYVNTLRLEGQRLWSADADKTILVWDLQAQAPVQRIGGFTTDIWRFTVRPNGQIITIGGSQPFIRRWRLEPPSGS
ncbi:serine/threonine-protein kinase [Leptolyngbya sp. KIOST-1]|uniref:serine/threonine-protein kinase n=1 Tax=Leptolyngbya sp. KIOST-1 TaxID=1229172 RepID=UPI00056C1152|nr:serine/threonine-protein kinase [Leptolyngbya sp. KIOST-1]